MTKKCEFPKNIGEYSIQEKENLSEDTNKRITYDAIANYSISDDITIFTPTAMIEIVSFDNENSAKEVLNDLVKNNFKDCKINDIKGFCYYNIREKDKKILATGKFYWLELQTLKTVFVNGAVSGIIEDAEKNVEEKLALFVSKFKNCKTE